MSGAAPDRTARRRSLRPPIAGAVLAVLLAGLLPDAGLAGQEGAPPPRDTLRLGELHRAVRSLDPRSRQLPLRRRATRARVEAMRSDWTPGLRLTAEGTYQTETPSALSADETAGLPPGLTVPEPPRDRYEIALEVEQLLWDGDRVARGERVARAAGAEGAAETRSALYGLREELDRAFFSVLRHQERAEQLRLLLEDLGARRRTLAARLRSGTLVPAELAAVDAEIVRARQELDAAEAARRAGLERLSRLLAAEVGPDAVLTVPDLRAEVDSVEGSLARSRHDSADAARPWSRRPEWRRLVRTRSRLRAEAALAEAETRPRVSAFVRGALGRPGLDFFDDTVSPYALMGVRVSWSLFDGGGSDARSRALRLEAATLDAERAALGDLLRRRASAVLPEIRRLVRALASGDRLVELQERRRTTALRRLEEGVLLPSEYVERRTDVFEARLRRRTHRVRLAEERARLLRILGRSLPGAEGRPGLAIPLRTFTDDSGARR